jgi:hypothetical protein
LVEVARDRANEDVRFHRPLRPIPSEADVAAIIAAEKAHVASPAPAPSRQRRADVIEIADFLRRDVLAEYRDRQRPQLEPEAT